MYDDINSKEYNLLAEMLNASFIELKDMSKKSPNDILKPMKVSLINRILQRCKDFFDDEPSVDFLDLLDDEDLPSNSDAVLIMSQYVAAFINFYKKYGAVLNGNKNLRKVF